MLNKFEGFIHRISHWFQWVGIAAMLVMMVVTCLDVIGSKAFKFPVLGSLDIVMLSQILAISFAAAITLIAGRHVQVKFFFDLLPSRAQVAINLIILLLGIGLFILIIWRLSLLGYSFQKSGEYSPTAYIPLYPFAYGVALASIPVLFVLLLDLFKIFKGREHR